MGDERGRLWLPGRCAAHLDDGRGALYPFAAETAAYQDPAVKRVAPVGRNGRRVLAVEYYPGGAGPGLARLREELAWACVDELRVCPRIPVDKRHNARIDYPALHRLLDRMERAGKGWGRSRQSVSSRVTTAVETTFQRSETTRTPGGIAA